MKWKIIIFDLDGVICQTDQYHYLAWKKLSKELGIPFSRSLNNRLRGVSRMQSLEILLGERSNRFSDEEKEMLAERKNQDYRAMLQKMTPNDLSEDVHSTLLALRQMGYRLAIGSSSKNAMLILERIGLGSFFDAAVDGRMIQRSKPEPEVFLLAAAMLNARPQDCLVVEDAEAGLAAAKAGGFTAVGLGKSAYLMQADYHIERFSQLLSVVASKD